MSNDKMKEALEAVMQILGAAPELNPSNYNHEDACALNAAANEAYNLIDSALSQQPESEPVEVARLFHATYERLAPDYGYDTREDTQVFDPASANGRLMTAVCAHIMQHINLQQERETLGEELDTLQPAAAAPQPESEPLGHLSSLGINDLAKGNFTTVNPVQAGAYQTPIYLHAQPSAQVEAEAVERFWEYLQDQGVVSKTAPSMVYDEYMLALQDCDPVDEVDSYGLWSPRVRQAIKEAFFAGREAGSAAQVPEGAIHNGLECLRRLRDHYEFADENGHALGNCYEYQEVERAFHAIAAPSIAEKDQ